MIRQFRTALVLAVWVLLSLPPTTQAAQLLYVSNAANNRIIQIDAAGNVSTFASSGLNAPVGLALDTSGNLYVANLGNGTISEFSPTGAPKGTFASGLNAPWGLAFDASGNLYVANNGNGTISEFSPTGAPKGISPPG
jgi:DNA-binding beta-propeller fold protein YncE